MDRSEARSSRHVSSAIPSDQNIAMTRRLLLPRAVIRLVLLAAAVLPLATHAQEPRADGPVTRPASDSATVAATVDRYHRSLASGDSAGALALLAPDAVILESGSAESRAEYRSHHLPADIKFARAVPSRRGPVRVKVQGDAAWATSTSTTQGEFRGRAVNSAGAELMVLTRTHDGWRIAAIHWSSRTRR